MLFQFKHRGAISITAETLGHFIKGLLNSRNPNYQALPQAMLERVLESISVENHSTILRRSAGIPPTILAILRAEPAIIKANRAHN